ncbi:hypothetical protein BUALT_Bualt05G0123300 [Buddleja alternifolia]|uniref:Uncharacterized protein n=1 Tax=Buddleja alternifolia TaxID=168488 RepID=A0AAV6XQK2_9LAMI|nr:hypothetical protein BUALT_Bualt05G0123300 [Buddleja alternifolia]
MPVMELRSRNAATTATDWYDVKAPSIFNTRNVGKTLVTRTQGTKAALCTIWIIKKVLDLAENFINLVVALVKEKHPGVLLTGVQLCTDMCKVSTEALKYLRKKCIDGLVKVLRDLANSPYAPEDMFLESQILFFILDCSGFCMCWAHAKEMLMLVML